MVRTKEEALKSGEIRYFTGQPCRNGHIDWRYTSTGVCYECKRQRMLRDYRKHAKRVIGSVRKSYAKHKKTRLAGNQRWAERNRSKSNDIKKAWKVRNRRKYLASESLRNRQRRQSDPLWRLNKNTCKGIWDSLKKTKGGRHWESLVDFTLTELHAHLEVRFKDGMTWSNYGSYWEIDHVKPVSRCSSFEDAWLLSNLQPLERSKNRSKGNRYIG